MKELKISSEYITIGQLLKLNGYIVNGGEAKVFLAIEKVLLDGIRVSERGKKVYPGTVVTICEDKIRVVSANGDK